MNLQVSDHFTLEEVIQSAVARRLAINNSLPPELYPTIQKTALRLEKVRAILGKPILVNSWYRCPELNAAVGSKPTSQHPKGEAVDFRCPQFGTPQQICMFLMDYKDIIRWDQLVLEHTWVHISWNSIPSGEQRGQVLSLLQTGDYAKGLTDVYGQTLKG